MDILGSAATMLAKTPHIGTGVHALALGGSAYLGFYEVQNLTSAVKNFEAVNIAVAVVKIAALVMLCEATSRISAVDVRKHVTAAFNKGTTVVTDGVRFANNKLGDLARTANDWLANATKEAAKKPAA